jgi:hypothetical protein
MWGGSAALEPAEVHWPMGLAVLPTGEHVIGSVTTGGVDFGGCVAPPESGALVIALDGDGDCLWVGP